MWTRLLAVTFNLLAATLVTGPGDAATLLEREIGGIVVRVVVRVVIGVVVIVVVVVVMIV